MMNGGDPGRLVLCCPCARPFPDGKERESGDNTFYCGPRRVGNTVLLCGKKEGRFPFHCMVGANWQCMVVTYVLIIGITASLLLIGTGEKHWISTTVASGTCALVLLAFSATACSDPGIVYRAPGRAAEGQGAAPGVERMEAGDVLCGRCDVKRPAEAMHCTECDVCVRQFDHHCPWTGKCIGQKNIRFFHFFLASLVLHVVVVVVLVLASDLEGMG